MRNTARERVAWWSGEIPGLKGEIWGTRICSWIEMLAHGWESVSLYPTLRKRREGWGTRIFLVDWVGPPLKLFVGQDGLAGDVVVGVVQFGHAGVGVGPGFDELGVFLDGLGGVSGGFAAAG